jgi:hypothetical protein
LQTPDGGLHPAPYDRIGTLASRCLPPPQAEASVLPSAIYEDCMGLSLVLHVWCVISKRGQTAGSLIMGGAMIDHYGV